MFRKNIVKLKVKARDNLKKLNKVCDKNYNYVNKMVQRSQ